MIPADHRCIACDQPFNREDRPAGEIRHGGRWGDACPTCYEYYKEDVVEDDSERLTVLTGWGALGLIAATAVYYFTR